MTQEEKELVIKDLCSRLPYNCMISIAEGGIDGIKWADVTLNSYLFHQIMEEDAWEYVKPYLRPMSSMTKEEKDEMFGICTLSNCSVNSDWEFVGVEIMSSHPRYGDHYSTDYSAIDWLNKNMFDYRDLISKGLALKADDNMYNNYQNL